MKKPFAIEDYFRIQDLGDPRISPDGKRVAYVVTEVEVEENRRNSDIHLADVASGESFKLTNGPRRDDTPRWSPDGERIAFVSQGRNGDRLATRRLWTVDAQGGEPRNLIPDEEDFAGAAAWSPDGRFIHFIVNFKLGTALNPPSCKTPDRPGWERCGRFSICILKFSICNAFPSQKPTQYLY